MISASPHYLSRVKGYSQLLLSEARNSDMLDEWMDGWMGRWTDEKTDSPCVLQDLCPTPPISFNHKPFKQNMGIADHMYYVCPAIVVICTWTIKQLHYKANFAYSLSMRSSEAQL